MFYNKLRKYNRVYIRGTMYVLCILLAALLFIIISYLKILCFHFVFTERADGEDNMIEKLGTDTAMTSNLLKEENKRFIPDEKLLEYLFISYLEFRKDATNKNVPIDTFTSRDYEHYKKKDFPSVRTIIRRFDSWNNAVSLIPDDILNKDCSRKLHSIYFSQIVNIIMNTYHIDDWNKVRILDYNRYRRTRSDIPDWRTLSEKILDGKPNWKDTIHTVFDEKIHIEK